MNIVDINLINKLYDELCEDNKFEFNKNISKLCVQNPLSKLVLLTKKYPYFEQSIELFKDDINKHDTHNKTPLIYACQFGNITQSIYY
jgi:ankyrin repeat protein